MHQLIPPRLSRRSVWLTAASSLVMLGDSIYKVAVSLCMLALKIINMQEKEKEGWNRATVEVRGKPGARELQRSVK